MSDIYILYLLECADGSFYCGITNDIEQRLKAHRERKGSKYVRSRLPAKVVYTENCETRGEALKREIEIKKMSKEQKAQLIEEPPHIVRGS